MGNIVVALQFQDLGVNQDHPAFRRCQPVQQGQQDTVQPDRFARTRRARHQQMRHDRKISNDRLARDILAQNDRQQPLGADKRLARHHLLERDHLAVDVRQFDTHHRAPRYRRDTRRYRAHIAGDIVGQADHPARLDARGRLQLIHRDDGAGAHALNLALDVEIIEHRLQQPRIAFERQLVDLRRRIWRRISQQIERRQREAVEQIALPREAGDLGGFGGVSGVGDFGGLAGRGIGHGARRRCFARLAAWFGLRILIDFGNAILGGHGGDAWARPWIAK